MKYRLILAFLLLASAASAQQNATFGVLWTYSSGKDIAASALVVPDMNGDKKPDIIVQTDDGVLHVLTPAGSESNSLDTGDSISSDILAADMNGDGLTEFVYGSNDGALRARNSSGSLLWSFPTGGKITATPVYLKQTGEILFGSYDGTFYALDTKGALSWSRKTGGAIRYAATSADVDRNGKPGIVYGSDDDNVYYVNRFALRVYSYPTEGAIAAPPIAKDINLDGRPEIIAATAEGKVYALNVPVNGSASSVLFRWEYNASGSIDSSLGAADLDGDKKSEIFFGASGSGMAHNDNLYILNSTGKEIKAYTTTGAVLSSPVDGVFGDKKTEIVFGTDRGMIYILNSSGDAKWVYAASEGVKHSPYAYDFNGDGRKEILLPAGKTLYLIGSLADNDSDGLSDYEEYLLGTNRNKNDTDGDGLADGIDSEPLKKKASNNTTTSTTQIAPSNASVKKKTPNDTTTSTILPAPQNAPEETVNETVPENNPQETPPAANDTIDAGAAGDVNTIDAPTPQNGTDYAPVILFMAVLGVLMYASRRSKGKAPDRA